MVEGFINNSEWASVFTLLAALGALLMGVTGMVFLSPPRPGVEESVRSGAGSGWPRRWDWR